MLLTLLEKLLIKYYLVYINRTNSSISKQFYDLIHSHWYISSILVFTHKFKKYPRINSAEIDKYVNYVYYNSSYLLLDKR